MSATPTTPTPPRPPRLPLALLGALLPAAEREEVLADLGDEYAERIRGGDGRFRAAWWVWRQALASLPSLLRRAWWRGRTGFEPHASAFRTGGPAVEQWIMDFRFAARRLLRRPWYAFLAVGTLALGVGGTAALTGIARAVLLSPLPYTDPEGIGLFWMPLSWSQEEFAFLREGTPGFSELAQFHHQAVTLERAGGPARLIPGVVASHELFSVLGAAPFLGRTFEATDDVSGAAPVAVLSYGLWRDLGGAPEILGSSIVLDGRPHTVIGVMPRGFWFPSPAERVWLPQRLDPADRSGNFTLVGRVAPGNHLGRMDGPIGALTSRLGARFQYPPQWDKTKNPVILSVADTVIAPLRPAIMAALVALAMILLIACANVAALMLGQVEGRAVELGVRAAMGADRARLTTQLLAEAILVGAGAGVAGAIVAAASFRLLVHVLPLGAWAETASLDWTLFAVAMAVALVASLAVSLAPVLALWYGRLQGVLASGRSSGIAGRRIRLESALVVAEVAIAVLLAAGAGVLARSVSRLYAIDPGFAARGVGEVDLVLPSDLARAARDRALGDLLAQVRSLPGVVEAGITQQPPVRAASWNSGILVEGKPDLPPTTTMVRVVSPGYLQTMGAELVEGRFLDETDLLPGLPGDSSALGAVVINQSLARKFFEGGSPLGRWVSGGFGPTRLQVVGVVRDVQEGQLADEPAPARYMLSTALPFTPQGQTLVFRVEPGRDLLAALGAVRELVASKAPRVAIAQTTTMEAEIARSMGPVRNVMTLVSIVTGLALFLGAIGVYGVMSHFVLRRQRDWGIQLALGLQPGQIIGRVVGRAARLILLGILTGVGAFGLLGGLLRPFVYGVAPTDPVALAAAPLLLLLVGCVAALVPAARAGRTDPVSVLRDT